MDDTANGVAGQASLLNLQLVSKEIRLAGAPGLASRWRRKTILASKGIHQHSIPPAAADSFGKRKATTSYRCPVLVSRIAMGIPVGSELEFADEVISKALEGRREM